MTTLYRQYRPAAFGEVTGQNHVTHTLIAAIAKNRLAHAYLFHGPRGTGKTSTARIFAKRINCLNPTGAEPCGLCQSCQAVSAGNHPDVIEIDAASNRGIDDIRGLRERAATVPILSRFKVYIIDEVHMLTNEASAALLKTLEEPVAHVLFILATTELHKVLPTILSRCQVFRFRRATTEELTSRLNLLLKKERRTAEPDALQFIIDRSDGCYRDAESLLGQLLTLSNKKIKASAAIQFLGLPPAKLVSQFVAALQQGESAPAVQAIDETMAGGYDPEQFLQESVRHARNQAMDAAAINSNHSSRWAEIIRALLQALQDLAFVPHPIIALHLAILTICTTRVSKTSLPVNTASPVVNKIVSPPAGGGERGGGSNNIHNKTPFSTNTPPSPDQAKAIQKITAVWPQLIAKMKTVNPVASTFLRAVEPISLADNNITIRTKYSLHHNFFDNPKNKTVIANFLSQLLNQTVTVSFILDDTNPPPTPTLAQQRQQQEDKFYQTVKEVFET